MGSRYIGYRRGLATVVSATILLTATVLLGTAGISWSSSILNVKQAEAAEAVANHVNKIKESIIFESVYCNTNSNTLDIALTNVGSIGVSVAEITISDKVSGFYHVEQYQNADIMPDGIYTISITENFPTNAILDITVSTSRGNIYSTQTST